MKPSALAIESQFFASPWDALPKQERERAWKGRAEFLARAAKDSGWWNFQALRAECALVEQKAACLSFKPTQHLVIGIGGSSLGAKAILETLGSPNLETIFLETPDPLYWDRLRARLVWNQLFVTVISKSGNTFETLSLFDLVCTEMKKNFANWRDHLAVITDPEQGALRKFVEQEAISLHFPIPKAIGGRFSVLTAVGLWPAALAGIRAGEILNGAALFWERAGLATRWDADPALYLALAQFAAHKIEGRSITGFIPYSALFREFGEWLAQLWAESIGKRFSLDAIERREGFTPLKLSGTADQHSQFQLFLEGPRDKWMLFLEVDAPSFDSQISPHVAAQLGFRPGTSWATLMKTAREASAKALFEQDVPSLTLHVPDVTPAVLGELFCLFELQTAYLGCLYEVNPFDQPGVERIKVLTQASLA